jgi:SAM-dependent methyltransferase
MPTEFDDYAANYRELVRDPIRDLFADGSGFFFERKWILLAAFLKRRGIRSESAGWLDVGCGQGELLRLGKSSFKRIAGCDVSNEMLTTAGDLNVTIQKDPERLPYGSGEFDLVTAVCVYHHVTADDMRHKLTAEIRRVLKPGGVFCIIEHNPLNPATRLMVSRIPVDRDARLLTPSLSRTLLAGGGLRVIESEFFLYLPERLYRKLGAIETWMKRIPLGGQYAIFAEKPV